MRRVLIALLVLGCIAALSIRYSTPGALPTRHAAVQKRTTCPQCYGSARIKCQSCQGFGSVESATLIPCDHCKGTGMIQGRLSKTSSACPYCGAKGTTSQHVREPCQACKGYGCVVCPKCGGSRFIKTAAGNKETLSAEWRESFGRGLSDICSRFASVFKRSEPSQTR